LLTNPKTEFPANQRRTTLLPAELGYATGKGILDVGGYLRLDFPLDLFPDLPLVTRHREDLHAVVGM
jgi:hypothetical protein